MMGIYERRADLRAALPAAVYLLIYYIIEWKNKTIMRVFRPKLSKYFGYWTEAENITT